MIDLCQHFVAESHTLLLEADLWGVSLSSLPQNVRVTVSTQSSARESADNLSAATTRTNT